MAQKIEQKLQKNLLLKVVERPEGRPQGEVRVLKKRRFETAVGTIKPVYESALASKLLARVAEIHVIETDTGRRVMGPISRARYGGIAWLPDVSGFFFTRQQEMTPGMAEVERDQKLRSLFVKLGTDPEQAPSVLAFDTPGVSIKEAGESPYVFPLPGTPWAAGYVSHGTDRELSLYVAPLADVTAGRAKWRKVIDRSDDVIGFEVVGDRGQT